VSPGLERATLNCALRWKSEGTLLYVFINDVERAQMDGKRSGLEEKTVR